MKTLDDVLGYVESKRQVFFVAAGALIFLIAWADKRVSNISVDFLYLLPILLVAAVGNGFAIVLAAALCGYLRQSYDPLRWGAGAAERLIVTTAGYGMTGFFVAELNRRRRKALDHIVELKKQALLRSEAELQLRVVIETSPLAFLTLDSTGRTVLANASAGRLLGFDENFPPGEAIEPYLPTLSQIVRRSEPARKLQTEIECRAQRRDGQVFLAHVWFSTYVTSAGLRLAAVIWDASDNVRDREGARVDSMLATSRVLIGAVSHEIRNLTAAAAVTHGEMAPLAESSFGKQYRVLGSLIHGLEKIAASGLRLATGRQSAVAHLRDVLDEARIVMDPAFVENSITATWEIAAKLPRVQADHHALLQVFINLARNSQRALENVKSPMIHIQAAVDGDYVAVRITDNGPGVAHPDELFQPFQAGAHSTGLGLYVSRASLRSSGGDLLYERMEQGSSFVVKVLPAGQ